MDDKVWILPEEHAANIDPDGQLVLLSLTSGGILNTWFCCKVAVS